MSNTIRIKRRANGGGAGAPTSLANAELAYNEQTDILYYGKGTGGEGGTATAAEPISGKGAFIDLASTQDVPGAKTFTGTISVPTPTSDAHAANKGYVDAVARGLDWKPSVRVATASNITLSGVQTIDGVSVVAGDRVLVKSQSAAADNGIYTVVSGGSWTRAADFSATGGPGGTSSATSGATVFVSEGTTYGNTSWTCTTDDPITLGTTTLSFSQIAGSGSDTTAANVGASGTGVFFGTQGNELQFRKLVAGSGVSLSTQATDDGSLTVAADSTVVRTTGVQNIAGLKTFTDNMTAQGVGYFLAQENAMPNVYGSLVGYYGMQLGSSGFVTGAKLVFRVSSNATQGGSLVFGSDGNGAPQANILGEIKNLKNPTVDHDAANKAYVDTQVGGRQVADATLTALAGVTTAADKLIYATGVDTFGVTDLSSFARGFLDDADAATARGTLGLASMATQAANNVNITGGAIAGVTIDGGTF